MWLIRHPPLPLGSTWAARHATAAADRLEISPGPIGLALGSMPCGPFGDRFSCAALASVGRRAVPAKPRRPHDGTARDGPLGSRLGRRPCTASGTWRERECPTFL